MTDEQKEPINNKALAELRDKIDEVDRQIVQLLNTRAKLVVDVGKLKRGKDIPIYAPHREQAVLKVAVQGAERGVVLAADCLRQTLSGQARVQHFACDEGQLFA